MYQRLSVLWPVAKAGIPEEGQVDALKLGIAQVLAPPALDILDPVDNDGPAQDVGQAEDVRLLQGRPRLTRQAEKQTNIELFRNFSLF